MQIDNKPRYIQIKEYLLEEINSGRIGINERLPSEKELCETFSVSRITVRKALEGLEESGLLYRVPGRGTFVSVHEEKRQETALRTEVKKSDKQVVGVILATLENPFQVSLLEACERAAADRDIPIFFGISNGDMDTESQLIDQMISNGVDGIILYPADGTLYSERVLKLKIDNFPVVLIDRYLPGINTCSVHFDNKDGGYQIGRYLIERGHKDIGILTSPSTMTSSLLDRIEGFRAALLNAGIALPLDYGLYDLDTYTCPDNREGYEENAKRIFDFVNANPELTALYCVKGNIATCAYKALKNLERHVEIASFDDVSGFEWTEKINIIQLQHSEQMMGKCAVEQIQKLMNGEEAESVIIPCYL